MSVRGKWGFDDATRVSLSLPLCRITPSLSWSSQHHHWFQTPSLFLTAVRGRAFSSVGKFLQHLQQQDQRKVAEWRGWKTARLCLRVHHLCSAQVSGWLLQERGWLRPRLICRVLKPALHISNVPQNKPVCHCSYACLPKLSWWKGLMGLWLLLCGWSKDSLKPDMTNQ